MGNYFYIDSQGVLHGVKDTSRANKYSNTIGYQESCISRSPAFLVKGKGVISNFPVAHGYPINEKGNPYIIKYGIEKHGHIIPKDLWSIYKQCKEHTYIPWDIEIIKDYL